MGSSLYGTPAPQGEMGTQEDHMTDDIYKSVKSYEVSVVISESEEERFAELDTKEPGSDHARLIMGARACDQLAHVLMKNAEFHKLKANEFEKSMGIMTKMQWTVHFVTPGSPGGNALLKARNDGIEDVATMLDNVGMKFEATMARGRKGYIE